MHVELEILYKKEIPLVFYLFLHLFFPGTNNFTILNVRVLFHCLWSDFSA